MRRSPPASEPKRPGKGGGEAPTKLCPDCGSVVHASLRQCPDCGHLFPPPEPQIDPRASQLAILSTGRPEWVPVTRVSYSRHEKPGKPTSLRVDYASGLATHSEWVCLEHPGYPRRKAAAWWYERAPHLPLPQRVEEALACAGQLRWPAQIAVRPEGRFTRVVAARFAH